MISLLKKQENNFIRGCIMFVGRRDEAKEHGGRVLGVICRFELRVWSVCVCEFRKGVHSHTHTQHTKYTIHAKHTH